MKGVRRELEIKTTECEHANVAMANLQSAMEALQSEYSSHKRQVEGDLEQLRKSVDSARSAEVQLKEREAHIAELNTTVNQLSQQVSSAHKYIIKLETDNATLRKGVEQTMQRLQASSDSDLVDRRVVVKMLLTYYERENKDEIIGLMSKILRFTDEERKRLLSVTAAQSSSAWTSFFVDPSTNATPPRADGGGSSSLADRWVDFLVTEGETNELPPAAPTPRVSQAPVNVVPTSRQSQSVTPPAPKATTAITSAPKS